MEQFPRRIFFLLYPVLHFPSFRLFSDVLRSCTSCQCFIFSVWLYSLYSVTLPHVLVATSHTAPDRPVPWQLSLLSSIHFISRAQAALLPPMFFISTFVSKVLAFLPLISFFPCYSGVPTSYFLFSSWSNVIGSLTFSENQIPPTPAPT